MQKLAWGLGWGLEKTTDGMMAFHWGDVGDYKGFVAINLEKQTAVVYFANSWNGLAVAQDIVSATVGDLSHGFKYLYDKFGFKNHKQENWKDKQNYETVANHVKYERSGSSKGLAERFLDYLKSKLQPKPSSDVIHRL